MNLLHIWLLPFLTLFTTFLFAVPFSRYITWIMEGTYSPLPLFGWIEKHLDSGHQTWKQYAGSLLLFSTVLFVFGYLVLALQPYLPLNAEGKTLLSPSVIFHSVASFMTNTDLQHYAGEQHLSLFSQIFFCIVNFFLSPAIGLGALMAIIRALRGDALLGNFFVDIWRAVVYLFLPLSFVIALLFLHEGSPMTFESSAQVTTVDGGSSQVLPLGPIAAFESIKLLGTNGGGFYGMNAAHPFENPTGLSNFFGMFSMLLFPFSLVLVYGRMLKRRSHSCILFAVMLLLMLGTILWTIRFDTLQPNPALIAHPERTFDISTSTNIYEEQKLTLPPVAPLPVDQHLGNLEGKEMRFGTSAGALFSALTTDVTCGAVNAEMDSLNPLAALAPMVAMWLNCLFGGIGIGMINLLLYIIIGTFIAGLMVGRTPEYLGKKIGAREVKLAILALFIHPFMILMPLGLLLATDWGREAISNHGAHGFSQMLYQLSSASANNGSAFDGLRVTYGFYNNLHQDPGSISWDIITGIVMILSRFLPLIAPIALAASLGGKKTSPFGLGTLRDDTLIFGFLLLGTILLVGALLFFPVAVLGPMAEHLGPIPFGG